MSSYSDNPVFSALADSQKNAVPALNAAVLALKNGETLYLGGGKYDCYPESAFTKYYAISNNDAGEKPIAFPLIGKKHITIDGGGAELMFHGKILPFAVDGCEDVVIRNVKIDYAAPFYAQAEIVEADRHHTTLRFDGKDFRCRVTKNGGFCFYSPEGDWEDRVERALTLEFAWDRAHTGGVPASHKGPYFPYTGAPKDHGFLRSMYRDARLEMVDDNEIVLYAENPYVHTVGNYLVMTHSSREFPGIFLTDSKDVLLEDITLYHTAAMGVIGQCSENLKLCRVNAVPRPGSGRLLSVNADATHFVNCRGKLEMVSCRFTNMMDDACNIHGIYGIYASQDKEKKHVITLTYGHGQQRGIAFFRPGDRLAIIDSEHTKTVAEAVVISGELLSPTEYRLTLDREVPAPGQYDVVENLSTAPEVHLADCVCGNNRPRGFLISTAGKTVVERCTFFNMNQGIQLGGEMKDWYESGAVRDVTIRDNDFQNSAFAGGSAIYVHPSLRERGAKTPFHGKVVIEGNRFVQSSKRMLYCDLTEELIFRGNRFLCDPSLPFHPAIGETGISVNRENCGTVVIEDVRS